MKLTSVFVTLIAAAIAVAGPIPSEAHSVTSSLELNDIDHAAIDYLVARGIFDGPSLKARGLRLPLPKVRPGESAPKDKAPKNKSHDDGSSNNDGSSGNNQSSPKQPLKVTFHDASGPVSKSLQKKATKALKETINEQNSPVDTFPFCDATFVSVSL